ncbi:MFS general substrate transporter [Karstenula rhodostoma CBS 690.94]|uniref:MFS general substrate transporter n=1 Tax=Karstenula rhodostoma CBS 690.94 TaxID=1392251 RepID=A0A9P4PRR5_9PLEO|nr:MFS general substrate transporter [Karstenula rhodostoma CBS 690.94]
MSQHSNEQKTHLEPVDNENNAQNNTTGTKAAVNTETTDEETTQSAFSGYDVGLSKLALIYLGIQVALFMTLMESTIVSTSVVDITNGLGGYVKSSWLFTSYMLAFSGRLHSTVEAVHFVPVTGFAFAVLLFAFPKQLSGEPVANRAAESAIQRLKRFDALRGTLLLGITVPLTTALQQAAQSLAFGSVFVWPLLLVAGLSLVGFFSWQWYITTKRSVPEPVLPWRLLKSRACVGIMLNSFFSGCVMAVCTVQIPQRFIVLHNILSPLSAGTRLLAFSMMVPVGSAFSAVFLDKKLLTLNALLLIGGSLQTIGVVLLATLVSNIGNLGPQYGFEVIVGTGLGFVTTATFLLVPMKMEKRDLAVGTGMVAQFRILGGVISLAIVTCISTPVIRNALLESIPPDQTHTILDRLEIIGTLPEEMQNHVWDSFRRGFDLQMTVIIGFAAANILATLSMMGKDTFLEEFRSLTNRKDSTGG